jgi:hypothetical protein
MDVLAHGLWSHIMYRVIPETRNDKKTRWWGILFGILPDFASFTPIFLVFFYQLFTGSARWSDNRPDFENLPLANLTGELYSYTHSFTVFFLVFGLVWLIKEKFPWALIGWALHISIDIFSHSREFYPTPFLFPLSDMTVNGIPWSHPVFMVINYGLLFIFYLAVLPRISRKHKIT